MFSKKWTRGEVLGLVGILFSVVLGLPTLISWISMTTAWTGNLFCQSMAWIYVSEGINNLGSFGLSIIMIVLTVFVFFFSLLLQIPGVTVSALQTSGQESPKDFVPISIFSNAFLLTFAFLIMIFAFRYAFSSAATQAVMEFNKQLIILSEHEENDTEIRKLKSRFAQMQTRDDRDKINEKIKSLQNNHSSTKVDAAAK